MDTYSILSTLTTIVLGALNFFQWKAKRKATAEAVSIEIKNLSEAFEQLRIENNRLRDEIKELRSEIKELRCENGKLRNELQKIIK